MQDWFYTPYYFKRTMMHELGRLYVDYEWTTTTNDTRIWEYKYLVLQEEFEPKGSRDSSFLRLLRPTPRKISTRG